MGKNPLDDWLRRPYGRLFNNLSIWNNAWGSHQPSGA